MKFFCKNCKQRDYLRYVKKKRYVDGFCAHCGEYIGFFPNDFDTTKKED